MIRHARHLLPEGGADNAAYTAEKTLHDLGDRVPGDLKTDVENKIADVHAALATDDVQRMRDARDALQQAMFRISEQIYSQSGGASTSGEPEGENPSSGPSDDNTVEGEFKEA